MAKKKKDDPLAGIPKELHWLCKGLRLPSNFEYAGSTYGTVAHWQRDGLAVNINLLRDAGLQPLSLRRAFSIRGAKLVSVPYFKDDDVMQFSVMDLIFRHRCHAEALRSDVVEGRIKTLTDFQAAYDAIKTTSWSAEEASAILGRYGLKVYHTEWLPSRELGEVAVLEEVRGNFLKHYEEGHLAVKDPSKFFFAVLNDEELKAKLLVDAL